MEAIPALDLSEGCVVRLKRGEFSAKTVYSDDPVSVARGFVASGATRLHVVDLDGAKTGDPVHFEVIRAIAALGVRTQVGGGIRTAEIARKYAEIPNVDRLILGTAAVESPDEVKRIIAAIGAKEAVISVDVKSGKAATRGWQTETDCDPIEFGKAMRETGVRIAVYTDVSQDGMMSGPNVASTCVFAESTGLDVIVSGGVSSMGDLERIKASEHPRIIGVIMGRAIYEGAVDVAKAARLFL